MDLSIDKQTASFRHAHGTMLIRPALSIQNLTPISFPSCRSTNRKTNLSPSLIQAFIAKDDSLHIHACLLKRELRDRKGLGFYRTL